MPTVARPFSWRNSWTLCRIPRRTNLYTVTVTRNDVTNGNCIVILYYRSVHTENFYMELRKKYKLQKILSVKVSPRDRFTCRNTSVYLVEGHVQRWHRILNTCDTLQFSQRYFLCDPVETKHVNRYIFKTTNIFTLNVKISLSLALK